MNAEIDDKRNPWQRLRWQLVVAVLAASLPLVVRYLWEGWDHSAFYLRSGTNAWLGAIAANILAVVILRQLHRYPGVERVSAILPAFAVAFSILLFSFLMLRLDYSRTILVGAFFVSIVVFYFLDTMGARARRMRIGVVPQADSDAILPDIRGLEWIALSDASGNLSNLTALAADLRKDMSDDWERRLAECAISGVAVYHTKHLVESLTGRVELEHLSETSYGTLTPSPGYMAIKGIFDWCTALVALVVLSPLFAVVSLLIRMDSPGPAVFRQQRVGYGGRLFTVYKFRTMALETTTAEDERSSAMTLADDARITAIGRFLRKSRIDELPQVVNILRGEMSWIGPRPEAAPLSQWYEREIPFYRYRHIVKPGITGWAQVLQGHVVEVSDVQDKLYFDFYYVKHYSMWIDFLIVLGTIRTVFTGSGAR